MRRIVVWGALALTIAGSAQAAQRPARKAVAPKVVARSAPSPARPVFSFMGDDTEHVTQRTSLNAAACTSEGQITDCTDYRSPQVAGRPMKFMWMKFNAGRLYSVYGSFGEYAYGDLLAAFNAKYGAPSKTEVRKWQSKGGATFDNAVIVWHFKGGDLELQTMGVDINSGSFSFTSSENAPAAEKPKIDF